MKVYLSEYIAPSAMKRLKEKFEVVSDFNQIDEIDGIIVRNMKITRDIIERAKKLKVISVHGTGVDFVDIKAAEDNGVIVTRVPGENAESVAELAVSFILSLSRKHKMINKGLCIGKFKEFGMHELIGNEVNGKKLGLVGGGNVSSKVARIMKNAFNCDIYCYDPYISEDDYKNKGYIKVEHIEELFRIADFISISVPLTNETSNLIDKDILNNCNDDLILVNTSRGGIVNEDDLYDALIKNKIKAAASDVFCEEPPKKENKLLHLDNFIGTLHVGGSTEECLERVGNFSVDNLMNILL